MVDVAHRATGNQPHDQFNAFAAGFAHVVDVRCLGASHRVVDQLVEPGVVPLAVDQARTCTLQLVAHAAGAPNVHMDVFVVALHRTANRLTQFEAALATGHGVLHHIDGERDHRARPGVFHRVQLAAHQRQGHREAVVHVHLVHDGQVKVLLNDRLRDVRGQLRMTLDLGHWAWSPAFVGRRVLGRSANRKGRDHVQAESCCVVIEHQEDHVRLVILHPLLGEVIACKQRLPVIFLCLAQVHGCANGGHMRGENGCGDFGHAYAFFPAALACCRASPCGWFCACASPFSPM